VYQIRLKHNAEKDLDRLEGESWSKVSAAILALESTPRPHGCVRLTASEAYRIRVGDYRVIYSVDDKAQIVTIISVSHRKDAYRQF